MNIAIIFAGGVGSRLKVDAPKQFLDIAGKPILIRTIEKFQSHKKINKIYVVVKKEYIDLTKRLVKNYCLNKVVKVMGGGPTGQDSIFEGLKTAYNENSKNSIVLIHDGVRPTITEKTINDNIESVKAFGSAITCKVCSETIIKFKGEQEMFLDHTIDRSTVLTAQAPQSFILEDIYDAHIAVRKINPDYIGIIDSCTLMQMTGKPIHLILGNPENMKITTQNDFFTASALIENNDKYISNEAYLTLNAFGKDNENE